jgi:hypothetical protein
MTRIFITFIILFSLSFVRVINVEAQHFTSPSYIIDWGNFNVTSGKKNSTSYSLTDTVGQMAPGLFSATGYQVRSGFQYIYDTLNNTFSFEISSLDIAFGALAPGVGITQTHTITITTPSGHGYDISSFATTSFSNLVGLTIPPTTCDTGSCNSTTSAPWTQAAVYGFGFSAVGLNSSGVATNIGTSQFFTNTSYFRPFSVAPALSAPSLMSESTPVKNRQARLTYKVNASPLQPEGSYQTAIVYTAIPQY